MPILHANGIDLYYESHGAGPAVVLVHGFGDSGALWDAQVAAFRDRYQVVTLDMRGHARSEAPADLGLYTQDGVVEDVRAVMDAAGVERAVVGGHSLGGYTSLRFYQRYPDRVRGLILSDTGPGYRKMRGAAGWTSNNEKLAAKLEARWPEAGFDARAAGVGRHGGDAPIRHTARGLAGVYRGVMRMPPMVECSEVAGRRSCWWARRTRRSGGRRSTWSRSCRTRAGRWSCRGRRTGRTSTTRTPGTRPSGSSWPASRSRRADAGRAPPMPVRAAASPPRR